MRTAAAIVLLLLSGFLFSDISSASPAGTLRADLAALQKTSPGSPQERTLQKKIIGIVRKMGHTPPLSSVKTSRQIPLKMTSDHPMPSFKT